MQAHFQSFEPIATALKSAGYPALSRRLEEVIAEAKTAENRFKERVASSIAQTIGQKKAAGTSIGDNLAVERMPRPVPAEKNKSDVPNNALTEAANIT